MNKFQATTKKQSPSSESKIKFFMKHAYCSLDDKCNMLGYIKNRLSAFNSKAAEIFLVLILQRISEIPKIDFPCRVFHVRHIA